MNLEPLLTCPFCGGLPVYVYRSVFREWFVVCKTPDCNASLGCPRDKAHAWKTPGAAAAAWNTRHPGTMTQPTMHDSMRSI